MQPGQIFFSYSRVDGKFALKLGEDLRKAGVDIWIDQIDIRPSEPWDEEIEKALEGSACLLVILSPTSVESDNVLNEINYALENKKQVLPIIIAKNLKKPFNIGRLQHIDFTASYETGFNLLLKSLSMENPLPVKSRGLTGRIIPVSIIAVLVVLTVVLIKFFVYKSDTGNASTLIEDSANSIKSPSSAEVVSSGINGKWVTPELTNPFDENDKYIIYFDLEVIGNTLTGSINFKSTIEYKNYNIKKGFLEGRINGNVISFYTIDQSFSGNDLTTFKNYYKGSVLKEQISFTLESDRPTGFPGQKFIAKRTTATETAP